MKHWNFCLFALVLIFSASPLFAGSIPYANAGTVAATVTTYATTSQGIDLYYYGSTAGYTDYIGVYDVQTGYNSGLLFDNKTTAVGTEDVVGAIAGEIDAGDQLIFYIDSPEGIFASLAADSADGTNHAYTTSYVGGTVNNVAIPAGLFIGMEDENKSHSDLNYNDEDFTVTGASTSAVTPEPQSIFLFGSGLVLLIAFGRSRRASAIREG